MGITISGRINALITNELTGETREYNYDNLIMDAYLHRVAQITAGQNVGRISRFQLGTGSGTVTRTDATLFSPVSASVRSVTSLTANSNTLSVIISYPRNAVTGTFTEGGLLDSSNVLLTHLMLTPELVINADDSVVLTYTITHH